ncbi:unnamed protein product [Amoebophrya sp. A25]|nr:unnamed protein product [Amoebophrya sp. A25]|eukprot:GSA25T00018011001.1
MAKGGQDVKKRTTTVESDVVDEVKLAAEDVEAAFNKNRPPSTSEQAAPSTAARTNKEAPLFCYPDTKRQFSFREQRLAEAESQKHISRTDKADGSCPLPLSVREFSCGVARFVAEGDERKATLARLEDFRKKAMKMVVTGDQEPGDDDHRADHEDKTHDQRADHVEDMEGTSPNEHEVVFTSFLKKARTQLNRETLLTAALLRLCREGKEVEQTASLEMETMKNYEEEKDHGHGPTKDHGHQPAGTRTGDNKSASIVSTTSKTGTGTKGEKNSKHHQVPDWAANSRVFRNEHPLFAEPSSDPWCHPTEKIRHIVRFSAVSDLLQEFDFLMVILGDDHDDDKENISCFIKHDLNGNETPGPTSAALVDQPALLDGDHKRKRRLDQEKCRLQLLSDCMLRAADLCETESKDVTLKNRAVLADLEEEHLLLFDERYATRPKRRNNRRDHGFGEEADIRGGASFSAGAGEQSLGNMLRTGAQKSCLGDEQHITSGGRSTSSTFITRGMVKRRQQENLLTVEEKTKLNAKSRGLLRRLNPHRMFTDGIMVKYSDVKLAKRAATELQELETPHWRFATGMNYEDQLVDLSRSRKSWRTKRSRKKEEDDKYKVNFSGGKQALGPLTTFLQKRSEKMPAALRFQENEENGGSFPSKPSDWYSESEDGDHREVDGTSSMSSSEDDEEQEDSCVGEQRARSRDEKLLPADDDHDESHRDLPAAKRQKQNLQVEQQVVEKLDESSSLVQLPETRRVSDAISLLSSQASSDHYPSPLPRPRDATTREQSVPSSSMPRAGPPTTTHSTMPRGSTSMPRGPSLQRGSSVPRAKGMGKKGGKALPPGARPRGF